MTPGCPPDADLRRMLDDRLPDDEQRTAMVHIEECQRCQQALERMTACDDLLPAPGEATAAGPPPVPTAAADDGGRPGLAMRPRASRPGSRASPLTTLPGDDDLPGDDPDRPTVPGYQILEEIGRGGMGVVYRARHLGLDRMVALKMILAGEQASPQQFIRFRAEGETVARLRHPNIVQIYECAAHGRRPYCALEYVEGGSLDRATAGRPQPAPQAAGLVEALARAVHHAHQQGIVHRDLKPANILLALDAEADGAPDDGRAPWIPKITDFGLAKPLGTDWKLTQTGVVAGTPSYMAPEQVRSGQDPVGPATDVYALGAILYELLTGRPPFLSASTLETIQQVAEVDPVPPGRLRPTLPRDLETICLKCLEKEPRRRYAGADALAEDLRRFRLGEPIRARHVGRSERAWKWARRRPAIAGLSAAVALLMLALGLSLVLSTFRLSDRLWRSHLDNARAARSGRQAGQRFESLGKLAEAARIVNALHPGEGRRLVLRDEAIACLALVDLRLDRQWPVPSPFDSVAAADPIRPRYAHGEDGGGVVLRSLDDNRILGRIGGADHVLLLRFSPDGSLLAGVSPTGDASIVWDLDRGTEVLRTPRAAWERAVAFSPDGRQVAFGFEDGSIEIHRLGESSPALRLDAGGPPYQIAIDPAGGTLAAATRGGRGVVLIELETGAVSGMLLHPCDVRGVAWRPDGKRLAAGGETGRILLWDTLRREVHSSLDGHQSAVINLAFDPGGNLLASQGWDGTTRLWDAASGWHLVAAETTWAHQWSDGGRSLVGGAGTVVQRWEVDPATECRMLHHVEVGNRAARPRGNGPWEVDFHPGGRLLASASFDGVRLWDAATGREVAHLRVGPSDSALFLPDGSLLTHAGGELRRWPVAAGEGPGATLLVVGPPETPPIPADPGMTAARLARDRSGRLLAMAERGGSRAVVWELDRPDEARVFATPDVSDLALSPDGRWLATITWGGSRRRLLLWETDGRSPGRMLAEADGFVAFSPDGLRLVAGSGDRFRSWRVGSWDRPDPDLPRALGMLRGYVAYSADGRLAALAHSSREVRLIEPGTGRRVATLRPPRPLLISGIAFSPEGDRLAVATEGHVIQLWDLRSIRHRLAGLGLDWDLPADPAPDPMPPGPLRVAVRSRPAGAPGPSRTGIDPDQLARLSEAIGREPGSAALRYRRGLLHERRGALEDALGDYSEAYRLDPDPKYLSARGWVHDRLGSGEAALADWMASVVPDPSDHWSLYREAALRLERGERGRYLELCSALLEQFSTATDPYVVERVAKACLISGDPALDLERLDRIADRAHANDPELGWFLLTRGIAHYRLGQHERSLDALRASLDADRGGDAFCEALTLVFLAMNQAQKHCLAEARRSLAEADRLVADRLEASDGDSLAGSWHDLLFYRIARREAEAIAPR